MPSGCYDYALEVFVFMTAETILTAAEETVELIDQLDARLEAEEGHAKVLTYLFW